MARGDCEIPVTQTHATQPGSAKVVAMKTFPKILITGVMLVAMLLTMVSLGASTALPLTKKLPPGTTTVHYAGQELRFTTSLSLYLKLTPLSETSFELSVAA